MDNLSCYNGIDQKPVSCYDKKQNRKRILSSFRNKYWRRKKDEKRKFS